MHRLECKRYSVGVQPAAGGRVEWLLWRHEGREFDILRPRPEANANQGQIPLYGNFAMLPYCNRLLPAALSTSAGTLEVAVNWPSEGCAIHGLGCEAEWMLHKGATEQSCSWSCRVATDAGVYLGTGIQEISVSDETGVSHRACFRNEAFDWILAGVGFHPWFFMPEPDALLQFRARGRFIADEALYPQQFEELDEPNQELGPASYEGLDQCFGDWSGCATLRLPHVPARISIVSGAPHLHVYVSRSLQAICAEPQTHVTNATHDHRWEEIAGMTRLSRGECISVELRIAAHPSG